jgi:2-oxoglutarate-dependent dioxygenase
MDDPTRRSAPTAAQIEAYRRDGYCLLPGLLSAGDVAAIRDDVLAILAHIGLGQTKLKQTSEYTEGSPIAALVHSARLRALAGALLDGEAVLYLPFTAVKSAHGGGEFHFHQDNQYTRFDNPGINIWVALTQMTEENGCLRMVPGSHEEGTLPSAESPDRDGHRTVAIPPEAFVRVPMEAGDAVAFTRLTVHGSGPNTTAVHRVAYAVQYARADVRYSTDGGASWAWQRESPRWAIGPVAHISVPDAGRDGH